MRVLNKGAFQVLKHMEEVSTSFSVWRDYGAPPSNVKLRLEVSGPGHGQGLTFSTAISANVRPEEVWTASKPALFIRRRMITSQ